MFLLLLQKKGVMQTFGIDQHATLKIKSFSKTKLQFFFQTVQTALVMFVNTMYYLCKDEFQSSENIPDYNLPIVD